MSYRIQERRPGVFSVVEHRSTNEQVPIRSFAKKDEAKTFQRFLNLGGGFDGWTPDFFLRQATNDYKYST